MSRSDQLGFDLDLPELPNPASETTPAGSGREAGRHARGTTHRTAPSRAPKPPRPPKLVPFHYTDALWTVVRDIVATMDEFRHVDLDRIAISITQARQSSKHGTYASCVPLRFEGGARETVQNRKRFRMQAVKVGDRELLYLLYFVLPRFHEETDYHEKLATIIHELYHISPLFNGDIRRFPGKNFAHGQSREVYHAAMRKLADRYLAASPNADLHAFLKVPFDELLAQPGGVVGNVIPKPRILPIEGVAPMPGVGRGKLN